MLLHVISFRFSIGASKPAILVDSNGHFVHFLNQKEDFMCSKMFLNHMHYLVNFFFKSLNM